MNPTTIPVLAAIGMDVDVILLEATRSIPNDLGVARLDDLVVAILSAFQTVTPGKRQAHCNPGPDVWCALLLTHGRNEILQ